MQTCNFSPADRNRIWANARHARRFNTKRGKQLSDPLGKNCTAESVLELGTWNNGSFHFDEQRKPMTNVRTDQNKLIGKLKIAPDEFTASLSHEWKDTCVEQAHGDRPPRPSSFFRIVVSHRTSWYAMLGKQTRNTFVRAQETRVSSSIGRGGPQGPRRNSFFLLKFASTLHSQPPKLSTTSSFSLPPPSSPRRRASVRTGCRRQSKKDLVDFWAPPDEKVKR